MSQPSIEALIEAAQRWMHADPDPRTRSEVAAAIASADIRLLESMFGGRLQFGTAGIRGRVGPGPMQMNRLLAGQTAAGLARHLLAAEPESRSRGVAIGRDARNGSADFLAEMTDVLSGNGIPVHVVDGPAPTPFVAFALRHLNCAAGVVVTASHNPPEDNGIKVYWGDGAQIVPPTDRAIANAIEDSVIDGVLIPAVGIAAPIRHVGPAHGDSDLVAAYISAAKSLAGPAPPDPVTLVATSLHGVGAPLLGQTLQEAGFGRVIQVADQEQPDPEFPTVSFPNPEEPGALDELLALAEDRDAALALANDPDADRLALAAKRSDGTWSALTGDQTGAVLSEHLLHHLRGTPDLLFATTVVSSRLLGEMAAQAGAHFSETLTGFKWLCRPALEHPQWRQVLIYEEALGYAIGATTRDKDGISAAVVAADMANRLAGEGRSVWDVLDDLARIHGAHVTANGSIRLTGADWREKLVSTADRLAEDPPTQLTGLDVVQQDQPAGDVIRLWLEDNTRVVLRPSGTEPKFKYYCEAIEKVITSPEAAREAARERLDRLTAELSSTIQPEPPR